MKKKPSEGLWTDGPYNSYKFKAGGFTGGVIWNSFDGGRPRGFIGTFEHWKLKKVFDSLEEAKCAVEFLARLKVDELMTALKTGENT